MPDTYAQKELSLRYISVDIASCGWYEWCIRSCNQYNYWGMWLETRYTRSKIIAAALQLCLITMHQTIRILNVT